ncbi:hypothetical protein M8J76_001307 [Diaphorina citri]|nr:hypothetical protein M8J76_001307 [Diaphorina citri]
MPIHLLPLVISGKFQEKDLGLAAELFYVREGLVNEYALNFIVPVPAQIGNLHFTWQSLAGRPWAFGVLLWELTTLAQQPYAEIDPFEMAASLQDGYRLNQPVNCPDELFSVMAYCWAMNPEGRPTFPQLHSCLQEFHAQLTRYV